MDDDLATVTMQHALSSRPSTLILRRALLTSLESQLLTLAVLALLPAVLHAVR